MTSPEPAQRPLAVTFELPGWQEKPSGLDGVSDRNRLSILQRFNGTGKMIMSQREADEIS